MIPETKRENLGVWIFLVCVYNLEQGYGGRWNAVNESERQSTGWLKHGAPRVHQSVLSTVEFNLSSLQ